MVISARNSNFHYLIIYLQGKVEQQGTHSQLLAVEGTYKQLVQRQMMSMYFLIILFKLI